MSSKWCPKCGRINSVYRSIPNFCLWGCGSLKDEPLIPKSVMQKGYYKAAEIAREAFNERQRKLNLFKNTKTAIQMKLFEI